jgi:predicted dehydrogenase
MGGLRRRELIGAAGALLLPRRVLGGPGYKAPGERLNIAGIGVGGMGGVYLRNMESENIVALCDVDEGFAAKTFARYPNAKRYRDFRRMLEREKSVDAVVIGTPDHTHAAIAMAAIRLGKHVYCAKPLTRTIHEARLLARAARDAKVATQMSVQSSASEESAAVCDWIWSGLIGAVREVHVWSDRPVWPQGCKRPAETRPVPTTLDWDLWLGPAPARPYHPAYHPFVWRGWWDFGTGALGDMGCHALHTIFRALKLGHPQRAHATGSTSVEVGLEQGVEGVRLKITRAATPESPPVASMVTWDFPARGVSPPVRMTWYDGGLKPPRPPELEADRKLEDDGVIYNGEKGTILSGFTGEPALIPAAKSQDMAPPPKAAHRTLGHYQEWIDACKGGRPATCEFDFASRVTETALLGNLAVRTGKLLEWDAESMRISNDADANRFVEEPYRAGWAI